MAAADAVARSRAREKSTFTLDGVTEASKRREHNDVPLMPIEAEMERLPHKVGEERFSSDGRSRLAGSRLRKLM